MLFCGCFIQQFDSELNIFSAENALTLAEWLSVTILLTLSPISMRLSVLSLIFSVSHCPLNVTSGLTWLACGMAWTTKVVGCFNQTTINATIPLHTFSSLSTPEWYWSSTLRICTFINHFLKHKKVIFAELFKTYLWESYFSKARGLQPATLSTLNTFTGIF